MSIYRVLSSAFSCVLAFVCFTVDVQAQTTFGAPTNATRASSRQFRGSGRVASLRDQLRAGLKARRSVEFKFIDDVVKLVEQRKLPVKLVLESFHYARKKPTKHPFQYFQRVLALRAGRIGVKIKTV